MLLLLFALLLTGVVGWLLARPLLRPAEAPAAASTFNASVYRDQLEEVARDVDRGVLGEAEAAAARTEIERRLLAAAPTSAAPQPAMAPRASKLAAGLVVAAVTIAASGTYLYLGNPGTPDQPLALRRSAEGAAVAGGDPMHGQMDDLVRQLDAKLKENPSDPKGWALMARSLARLDRNADALVAYQRAIELTQGADGALQAEYAEMRVIANEGVVDAEAEGIFNRMLREEPGAPQARYYLALAKAQRGDEAGALVDWRALLADTPEDAPWRQALQARIAEASGLPAAPPPPQRPDGARGPTKEQAEAAQSMQPGDQQAMIENMVSGLAERLKQNPNDLDGWRRLARAYDVLGREAEARRAHERVLALSPNDPASLWSLGQYAKQRGDKAEARRRWQALERALPKDAPERGDVQRALQSL